MKDFYPANSDVKRTSKVVTVKELVEQGISKVTVDNGALKVDEIDLPVGPTPVAEFDGVKYYHKCEFDLETFNYVSGKTYNLLTGEELPDSYINTQSGFDTTQQDVLILNLALRYDIKFRLYPINKADFTSHSFTVVHDLAEVTDNTKICLPSNVIAYYGFLSEDGKTFISYWNEEGDEPVTTPVSKITDGKTEVEIHDERLDSVQSGTIVDALGLNAQGRLVKGVVSGGSKLYRHEITFNYGTSSNVRVAFILPTASQLSLSDLYGFVGVAGTTYTYIFNITSFTDASDKVFIGSYFLNIINAGYPGAPTTAKYNAMHLNVSDNIVTTEENNITSISDTVTEL